VVTVADTRRSQAVRLALTDPATLPTDLAVRSSILALLTIVSTVSIYSHLWLLTLAAGEQTGAACLYPGVPTIGGFKPGEIGTFVGPAAAGLACLRPYTYGMQFAGVVGAALVVLATLVVYLLQPAWIRRRHARPHRRPTEEAVTAAVAAAAGEVSEPQRHRRPRLLPAQTRRRQNPDGSHARAQTPAVRRRLPTNGQRRQEHRDGPGRTRGGDSAIQRGRPEPHGRHFGKVTSRTRQTPA
jgi:hypothetical protein